MKKTLIAITLATLPALCPAKEPVRFVEKPDQNKIEVYFGKAFFTSYWYTNPYYKPTLYPILAPGGAEVTRGYPVTPQPLERYDHPHQIGLWFNFGDVNGIDFWNNSRERAPEDKHFYGTIMHGHIVKAEKNTITTENHWVDNDGEILLDETVRMNFRSEKGSRIIERISTLSIPAQDKTVILKDNKEGLFAVRLNRYFEEPSLNPDLYLDKFAKKPAGPTIVSYSDAKGLIANDRGDRHEANVVGKTAKYITNTTMIDGEIISVTMADHPKNPYYAATAFTRGYGLFGLNNLAGRVFDRNSVEKIIKLDASRPSVTFRHLFIVTQGNAPSEKEILKIVKKIR